MHQHNNNNNNAMQSGEGRRTKPKSAEKERALQRENRLLRRIYCWMATAGRCGWKCVVVTSSSAWQLCCHIKRLLLAGWLAKHHQQQQAPIPLLAVCGSRSRLSFIHNILRSITYRTRLLRRNRISRTTKTTSSFVYIYQHTLMLLFLLFPLS